MSNEVSLLLVVKHNKILLFKRSETDESNPGKWAMIGGGIDPNETPEQALTREVKEEAGISLHTFTKLKKYKYGDIVLHIFYTNTFDDKNIKLNNEHSEYRYFTLEEMRNEKNIIPTNVQFVEDYYQAVKHKQKLNGDWKKTSWTGNNGKTVTLTQLLDITKNYPTIQAPIDKVKKIVIKKDTGGIETGRLDAADLKYPIIIIVNDNGDYEYILDGNHRANKAISSNVKSIPAKLVNINKLPKEFQDVLNEYVKLQEHINKMKRLI